VSVTAASLIAEVTVKGADTAKAQLTGVGEAAGKSGSALSTLAAGAILAAGTAIIGLGAKSVQMASDFQSSMTSLVTGAGESKDNIDKVSQGILNLAIQTGTSTKQLSDGMYLIESAGYHGSAGLDVLKASAQGAKVGNAQLADVANGVTTIMTDYANKHITASDATNTLIAAVSAGKTHMSDLSTAMATILPTASALNVKLPDVAGAMATMTGEGVPAADAATYLRQALSALENPSSKSSAALKEIGLTSSDVGTAMKNSLPSALQLITDHLKNKFPEGSSAYIKALSDISGGSKQMQGMLDLTGQHLTTFKNNVSGITDSVNKGKGSITGWASVQGDFNTKMDKAKEVLETLAIKAGTALLPVIGRILDAVTPIAQHFSDWASSGDRVKQFMDDSSPKMVAFKIGLIALAGAIGGVMVAALGALAVAAWAALLPLLPFILIGAAIALVIAGIVLAVTHWGEISKWLQDQWGNVSKFFGGIWKDIQGFFGGIGNWFSAKFSEARKGVETAFSTIGNWFHDRFKAAWDAITGVFGAIGKWFSDRWNDIATPLKPVADFLGKVFQTVWNIITAIFGKIGAWFHDRWNEILTALNTVLSPIDAWFRARYSAITAIFAAIGKWFHDRWGEIWTNLVNVLTPIGSWFQSRYNDVTKIFSGIGNWFHARFQEAWSAITTLFGGIGNWFSTQWNNVMNSVNSFKNNLVNQFNTVKNDVTNIFRGLINGIIDQLNNGISAVEGFINFFGQGLNNVAKALGTSGTIPSAHLGRIPHYASGTDSHPGGAAIVGEKGRELVFLPPGTKVAPNDVTEKLLKSGGVPGYAGGIGDITSSILGWVSGGASAIVNGIISSLNINLHLPGQLSSIATGAASSIKNWAISWVGDILSKVKSTVTGGTAGAGVAVNIPGNVSSWIASAMSLTGVPSNWASALATIAMYESGGNPNAVNLTDSNAQAGHPSQGLMQTIPSTFAAYMVAGHGNILNPIDNAAAAINYIKSRYGSVFNVPGIVSLSKGGGYQGYENGTSFAAGGTSLVGEKGPELMYVPRGAQITPNDRLRSALSQQVVVNPTPVYLDGHILANGLMPYIVNAIRYNVGTHGL
jgi:TP901 family phage tail tape measure protein